jgi:xanthosine utilization system XapX-like protein
MHSKLLGSILAVSVFVLLVMALTANEPAPYVVASLLGLLGLMVKAIYGSPKNNAN